MDDLRGPFRLCHPPWEQAEHHNQYQIGSCVETLVSMVQGSRVKTFQIPLSTHHGLSRKRSCGALHNQQVTREKIQQNTRSRGETTGDMCVMHEGH
jgi:hypothetical protein